MIRGSKERGGAMEYRFKKKVRVNSPMSGLHGATGELVGVAGEFPHIDMFIVLMDYPSYLDVTTSPSREYSAVVLPDLEEFWSLISQYVDTDNEVFFGVPRVNFSNKTIEIDYAYSSDGSPTEWAKAPEAVRQWDELKASHTRRLLKDNERD
jgi:hypothetical protein